jgi:hypothetical protein
MMYRFSPVRGESPLRKTGGNSEVVADVVEVAALAMPDTAIGERLRMNALTAVRGRIFLE